MLTRGGIIIRDDIYLHIYVFPYAHVMQESSISTPRPHNYVFIAICGRDLTREKKNSYIYKLKMVALDMCDHIMMGWYVQRLPLYTTHAINFYI